MFGNYKQLFNLTLNKSSTPTSSQCPKHPTNKLVYVCISQSCNTPICIKCQQGHTLSHQTNLTSQKYISYSEYTKTRSSTRQSINVDINSSKDATLSSLSEEKRAFIQIINKHFLVLQNTLNQQQTSQQNHLTLKYLKKSTQKDYKIISNRKTFTQLLQNCVYLDKLDSNKSITEIFNQNIKGNYLEKNCPLVNNTSIYNKLFDRQSSTQNLTLNKPSTAQPTIYQYRPSSSDRASSYHYEFKPSVNRLSLEGFNKTSYESEKIQNKFLQIHNTQQQFNYRASFQFEESLNMNPAQKPQESKNNTISKIADLFWDREPDKAYYSSQKNNFSQQFIRKQYPYFRS